MLTLLLLQNGYYVSDSIIHLQTIDNVQNEYYRIQQIPMQKNPFERLRGNPIFSPQNLLRTKNTRKKCKCSP